MADLLPSYPLLGQRNHRRKNRRHVVHIQDKSKDVFFFEHTTTDESRDLQLHLRKINLVGTTYLGYLHPGFDQLVITLAGTTGLGHLDPELDHLVITLVVTTNLTRLYPVVDHPEIVTTIETSSP